MKAWMPFVQPLTLLCHMDQRGVQRGFFFLENKEPQSWCFLINLYLYTLSFYSKMRGVFALYVFLMCFFFYLLFVLRL